MKSPGMKAEDELIMSVILVNKDLAEKKSDDNFSTSTLRSSISLSYVELENSDYSRTFNSSSYLFEGLF